MTDNAVPAAKSSLVAVGLVFVSGFVLAGAATAVLINVGPSPIWVWCLFAVVAFMLARLPLLKTVGDRTLAFVAYAVPFLTLWIASNPAPKYSLKGFIFHTLLSLFGLASILALGTFITVGRKSARLRKFAGVLFSLFVLCWLVAAFSSSTGSGSKMITFAMDYLGMSRDGAETAVLILRKTLHFGFYGILGWLALRTATQGGLKRGFALFALLFVLAHCSFDELRQSGYADRTGSVWDVCLDLAGAAVFIGVALARRQPSAQTAAPVRTPQTGE